MKINITVDLNTVFTSGEYDETVSNVIQEEFVRVLRKMAKEEVRKHETKVRRMVTGMGLRELDALMKRVGG